MILSSYVLYFLWNKRYQYIVLKFLKILFYHKMTLKKIIFLDPYLFSWNDIILGG